MQYGLEGQVEKMSEVLERNAIYTKVSRIKNLVRFSGWKIICLLAKVFDCAEG